jgi:hypothetical protein
MLYILRQHLLKSLLNKKQVSKGFVKTIFIYRRKLYFKLINKADIKLIIVNIITINTIIIIVSYAYQLNAIKNYSLSG